MFKTAMLAASLVALALAALPALASATFPDPYLAEGGEAITDKPTFTVENHGTTALTTSHTPAISCEKVTGEGQFTTPETGVIEFTFEECTTIFSLPCTSAGQESGDITTTELEFHLKTVDHGGEQTPGVLITPGDEEVEHGTHFASFSCPFIGEVVVGGTSAEDPVAGIVGTIIDPEEKKGQSTMTLSFEAESPGVQTHRTVTNDNEETTEYDLKASIGGSETTTAAQDGEGTIKFDDEDTKAEIRTTGE